MRIVDKLTALCIEREYLDCADEELFHFEIERRLSTIVIAIPFFILAVLLSNFTVASTFFWSFYFLRERTSGYHSATFGKCVCVSLALEVVFLKLVCSQLTSTISAVVYICFVVIILCLAPFVHPNFPLSNNEFETCKKDLRYRIFLISCIMLFSYILQLEYVIYGITTGVAMAGFLLCLAYIL